MSNLEPKKLVVDLLDPATITAHNLNLDDIEFLAGGVVSLILSIGTHTGRRIVLKHTKVIGAEIVDLPGSVFLGQDHVTLLQPAPATHALDVKILTHLAEIESIPVPAVLHVDTEKRVTLMPDFRQADFTLLQDLLVAGVEKFPLESAPVIGTLLANTVSELATNIGLHLLVESSEMQANERFQELEGFLRSKPDLYREIRSRFLSGTTAIPTDGHPKNLAWKNVGSSKDQKNHNHSCMIFDFGRTIQADHQFVLPNFAAHIGLATLSGLIPFNQAKKYLLQLIEAYNLASDKTHQINEVWFVRYFMTELLHRGLAGRWIDKRIFGQTSPAAIEVATHHLAIRVLRPETGKPVLTIANLLDLLSTYRNQISTGKFSQ